MGPKLYTLGGIGQGTLATIARPRGDDWLEGELRSIASAGVQVLVSMLTAPEIKELGLMNEGPIARRLGIHFVNHPLPDRSTPSSALAWVPKVQDLYRLVIDGKSAAIHCRAGIGRSSLMAACMLVTHGSTPESAWLTIEQARGRPVPDTEEQRIWLTGFAAVYQLMNR